jgi:antirestriction protein ArdC
MKMDIYQRITDQIVGELEKGVRPWNAELPLGVSPYRGINVLMLWSAAMEKGYAAPVWMTFKQARELKANVRTGEHGSLVVYADKIIRTEADTVRTRDSFHEGLHGLQCRADRQYAWHVQRNLAIADNYRDFAREIERTVAIVWVPIVPSD